jgi:citrate synthase
VTLTDEAVCRSVRSVIGATLDVPDDQVTPQLAFRSIPEWDSLRHVELMVALEAELGLTIPDDLVPALRSVAAIESYARAALGVDGLGPGSRGDPSVVAPNATEGVKRGLAGVAVDRTTIASIDGRAGELRYRGYAIEELLEHSTYEETCFLLLHGELPTAAQLEAFEDALRLDRSLPEGVVAVIEDLRDAHPMVVARTAVSALAAFDDGGSTGSSLNERCIRLVGEVAEIVATHCALRVGRPAPTAGAEPTLARHLLRAARGSAPNDRDARLLDRLLILHAEHGANASSFAARVATSTQADLHAALTAAIGTFSGGLHGGATEAVMEMLDEIEGPEQVESYVERRIADQQPVYGFGHRVYRVDDPRFGYMRTVAREAAAANGHGRVHQVLEALVEVMRPRARLGLSPNVDLFTGFLYRTLDLPRDVSAALFAVGRSAGWVAHVLEQRRSNVLIRPDLEYVGPVARSYEPLAGRRSGPRSSSSDPPGADA